MLEESFRSGFRTIPADRQFKNILETGPQGTVGAFRNVLSNSHRQGNELDAGFRPGAHGTHQLLLQLALQNRVSVTTFVASADHQDGDVRG